jgi:hypothetical protein
MRLKLITLLALLTCCLLGCSERPSLAPEVALANAPERDMGGFRVPSPGPAPA